MAKRARESLTGGTGDVNPQWMKIVVPAILDTIIAPGGAANLTRVVRQQLPVNRINQGDSKTATIIEVLQVRYSYDDEHEFLTTPMPYSQRIELYVSTAPIDAASPEDFASKGTTIDYAVANDFESPCMLISAGPPLIQQPYFQSFAYTPIIHDMTDGAGHGVLVATDAITIAMKTRTVNESLAGGGNLKVSKVNALVELLYRFKKVSLVEFIGIVQSQER